MSNIFRPREEAAITFQRMLDVIRAVEINADATDFARLLSLIDDATFECVPPEDDPNGEHTENRAQMAFLTACRAFVEAQRDASIRRARGKG